MKTGWWFLSVVLALCVSGVAVTAFNESKTIAEVEDVTGPLAAVDTADAQLREGNVWGAAVTLLDELRGLPPNAESIDDALAPMQFLSAIFCEMVTAEDLPAFVGQLNPQQYAGDALALMKFYQDYQKWNWEEVRHLFNVDNPDLPALIESFSASEIPLVRMGSLYNQLLLVKEHAKQAPEATTETEIGLVNRMAEECPTGRVTRDCFREVVRQHARRVEDIGPEGILALFEDPRWGETMQQLIAGDGVVQALMDILQSPAVTAAKSASEAAGQVLSAALDASASNQDTEVRAWFITWLSSYLPDKNGTSIFGEIVRAAFRQKVDFLMNAGPQADRIPPDLAVAQRAVYLAALRQLEGAKWSTGPSVIGPDLRHFQSLLTQKRAVEPIGENAFERLPVEVSFYGDMLTNQDQYQAAVDVWRRVVEVYPNTYYARYCQDKVDALIQSGLATLR